MVAYSLNIQEHGVSGSIGPSVASKVADSAAEKSGEWILINIWVMCVYLAYFQESRPPGAFIEQESNAAASLAATINLAAAKDSAVTKVYHYYKHKLSTHSILKYRKP